jgi:hypothetical protein
MRDMVKNASEKKVEAYIKANENYIAIAKLKGNIPLLTVVVSEGNMPDRIGGMAVLLEVETELSNL